MDEAQAREFLAKMSEDSRHKLMETARRILSVAYEGASREVPPELVEAMAVRTIQRLSDDWEARFREVTREEYRRIMDEEYERLRAEGQVDKEALAEAVRKRILDEYGHIVDPRRSRPPE
jgi:hypothetical protein